MPELLTLLRGLRRDATERSRRRTAVVATALDAVLPQARRSATLAQKALWVLASTPGVTSVLNGMRTSAYVKDSMAVLHWSALESVRPAYEAVKTIAFPEDFG